MTSLEGPEVTLIFINKKKNINLKNYIEKHSIELKKKYLEFCNYLENINVKKKKLYKNFEIYNKHNLWEMSLIKEKSNVKSKSIYKIIIALALKKIFNENKVKKVIFSNFPLNEQEIVSLYKNSNIIFLFNNNLNNKKNSFKDFFKNFFLLRFLYYLLYIFKKLFINLEKNFIDNSSNFVIFNYFAHYEKIKKKNINFNQFGYLQSILKKKYLLDNQYIFVPKKKIQSFKFIKKSINNQYSILNNSINFYDRLSIFYLFIFCTIKFFFIKKKILIHLKKINLTIFNLLSEDYDQSFSGPVLIDNLIWIRVFEKYLSKTKKKKIGLYLIENQPWEKAMITAWKNYGHGEIIGYTPTSINFWHLYNYDNSKKNYATPTKIFVSSNEGHKLLKSQYSKKKIKIHKVESLWFNYLKQFNYFFSKPSKNIILILGDYNPTNNFKVFEIISKSNIINKKIIFKPHPHDLTVYNYPKIFISNQSNKFFFNKVEIVISSGSTAAVLEYLYFGKKVLIYDDPYGLDMSPVKHLDYKYKFKSIKDFNKLLKENFNKKQIINQFKNYYYMDKNLKKWKNLFYI